MMIENYFTAFGNDIITDYGEPLEFFLSWFAVYFSIILFSQIVYNDICSLLITGLSFNVIVSSSVDNWTKISQKQLSAIFFLKLI